MRDDARMVCVLVRFLLAGGLCWAPGHVPLSGAARNANSRDL
jgi:hypothetical protein